jgi:hypothetical protein
MSGVMRGEDEESGCGDEVERREGKCSYTLSKILAFC